MSAAAAIEQPFDTIESAQEFMHILAQTALDAITELRRDREEALRNGEERKAQAIDLAIFKLKRLGCHVHQGSRMLNDLRILRRLILNERMSMEHILATL